MPAAQFSPITPENLIDALCLVRFGGSRERYADDLCLELYDFRRRIQSPITRQAIANWLRRGGAPTRDTATEFLRTYLEQLSRDDLTAAAQSEYDRLSEYFRNRRQRNFYNLRHYGHSNLSDILNHFFGARPQNVRLCRHTVGTYSLYFKSENFPRHIVHGAMKFSYDNSKNSFEVIEHQVLLRDRVIEHWSGYYFARKNFIIVILRGHGELLDNIPKFYIFYPLLDTEHVTIARGWLLKIGTGGAGGIFHEQALLKRDDDAFSRCDVIPVRNSPADIQRELGFEDESSSKSSHASSTSGRSRSRR